MTDRELSWFFDPLFFEEFEAFYQWASSSDCELTWNWNLVCNFFENDSNLESPSNFPRNPWKGLFNFERDNFTGNRLEFLAIYSLLFIGRSAGLVNEHRGVRNFKDLRTIITLATHFENWEIIPSVLALPISEHVGENQFMITLCLLYYLFAGTKQFPLVFTLSDYINLCEETGDWSRTDNYLQNWVGIQRVVDNQPQAWATLTLYRTEVDLQNNRSKQEQIARLGGGFNWKCINRRYATSIPWLPRYSEPTDEAPIVGPVKDNLGSPKVYKELTERMEKALGIEKIKAFNFPLGV